MSPSFQSFLDLKSLKLSEIEKILKAAGDARQKKLSGPKQKRILNLVFFEPSTRTKMSFEMACLKLGHQVLSFDTATSSMNKGESAKDTVLNLAALEPDALIIRCSDQLDLSGLSKQISVPLINAGWGQKGHPTQALLDLLTVQQHFKSKIQGKKWLFIGDVVHSRVASSHFELLNQFGIEIGILAPKNWIPKGLAKQKVFSNREDALAWCDVAYVLRVQFERHAQPDQLDAKKFYQQFGVTTEMLKKTKFVVMHPGPINHGIEFEEKLLNNPRCLVYEQVKNGVYVREAVLQFVFNELGNKK